MVCADLLALEGMMPQTSSHQTTRGTEKGQAVMPFFPPDRIASPISAPAPPEASAVPVRVSTAAASLHPRSSGRPVPPWGHLSHECTSCFKGLLNFHTKNASLRTCEAPCLASDVWPEGTEPSHCQNGSSLSSFVATRPILKCKALESQHRNIYQNTVLHRADTSALLMYF